MQHEAVGVFTGKRVNNLLVAGSTQSRYGEGLGFATGKKGRTMCTRQYAGLDIQRTDGAGIATVDTRLTIQNLGADNVGFQMFENAFDFVGSQSIGFFGNQRIFHCTPGFVQFGRTRLFLTDFERFFNGFACDFAHFGNQFFIGFRRFPIPYFRVYFIGELVDGVNRHLHLVVTVNDGTEHHVFRQDFGFRFHHQNGFGCTRNHQIQFGFRQFGFGRVQHIHTVYITHARCTNRTGKRYAAQHQRSGCAEHGRNIGIDFRVNGNHHRNDLDVVVETFGEQRTDRTVDQTAGQNFFFALFAFALKETAGDFTCGVSALKVINSQREEVLTFFDFFIGGHSDQNNGVAHRYFNSRCRLARDFAGFQSNGLIAILEGFNVFIEHFVPFRMPHAKTLIMHTKSENVHS